MIKLDNIYKKYDNGDCSTVALDHVNLTIDSPGLLFILGPSGSGKTTLLNMLGLLDVPDEGTISIDDKMISSSSYEYYRNIVIGTVFQRFNLISEWNVYENIELALEQQTWPDKNEALVREEVLRILDYVGLKDLQKRKIDELSGGQVQRVAIARALVKNPAIILADEPTGNLDSDNSQKIYALLKDISKDHLVIVVSHDEKAAESWGDRIIRLSDGHIVEDISRQNSTDNFSVQMKGDKSSSIDFTHLSYQRLVDKIRDFIAKGSDNKDYTISIQKEVVTPQMQDSLPVSATIASDKKTSNIKTAKLIKLAFGFLRQKKIRLCITTFLMTVMFLVVQLFMTAAFMKPGLPVYKATQASKDNYISIYEPKEYTSDWFDNVTVSAGTTDNIKDFIQNMKYSEILYNVKGYNELGNEGTMNLLIDADSNLKDNEIIITDYCAKQFHISQTNMKQNSICIYGLKFKVKEILNTDYESHWKTCSNQDIDYTYMMCKVGKGFKNRILNESDFLEIDASDFSDTVDESYLESNLLYANADTITSDEIVAGRLPQKDNEIVISASYASENDLVSKNGKISTDAIEFIDLNASKYHGAYENQLNLYDYLQSAKIVGIVEPYSDNDISVWVNKQMFQDIKKGYVDQIADRYFIPVFSNADSYQQLYDRGIHVDTTDAQNIDSLYSMRQDYLPLIRAVIFVGTICAVFASISFISFSIVDGKKKLGILKAIGTNQKDIIRIFSIEALLIGLGTFILQEIVYFLLIMLFNQTYVPAFGMKTPLVCITPFNIISAFLITLLCSGIASLVPIRKLYKKTPVDLFKD